MVHCWEVRVLDWQLISLYPSSFAKLQVLNEQALCPGIPVIGQMSPGYNGFLIYNLKYCVSVFVSLCLSLYS